MCKLIGYKYGRRYFSPDVVYRAPPDEALSEVYDPVGYVYCNANTRRRRLAGSDPRNEGEGGSSATANRVAVAAVAAATVPKESHEHHVNNAKIHLSSQRSETSSETGAEITRLYDSSGSDFTTQHRRRNHARSLLAALYGNISIPDTAPYWCRFRLGDCDYTGPLVGIECSNRRMPPAPPPPPSPPSAPPAPPPGSMSIRFIGPNGAPLEANICPSATFCQIFNRVELQVPHPNDGESMIWAPLCSAPRNFTYLIGNVACWQMYNWPRFARAESVVISQASLNGFPIPQNSTADPITSVPPSSPARTALFDPARVSGWASVTSMGNYNQALRIQDLDLEISTTPCRLGTLFAVTCTRRSER
ncbi:hypothetical protein Vafri_16963 [Volvox africanus]|nr:hypothetical protein Vafri_16963 [Volvox africanus]